MRGFLLITILINASYSSLWSVLKVFLLMTIISWFNASYSSSWSVLWAFLLGKSFDFDQFRLLKSPRGPTFTWWGCCGLCFWHKPTELAHSFLLRSCVYVCLYSPFNCISFRKFSRQPSAFSLCSSGRISAVLVLSTMYLFMKVSFSPDVILRGWLGLKHQLTD